MTASLLPLSPLRTSTSAPHQSSALNHYGHTWCLCNAIPATQNCPAFLGRNRRPNRRLFKGIQRTGRWLQTHPTAKSGNGHTVCQHVPASYLDIPGRLRCSRLERPLLRTAQGVHQPFRSRPVFKAKIGRTRQPLCRTTHGGRSRCNQLPPRLQHTQQTPYRSRTNNRG